MSREQPPRKKTCTVTVEVKCKEVSGKLLIKLQAGDEETIYLNGTWKLLSSKPDDLGKKVLKKDRGDFERKKDRSVVTVDAGGGNFISLEGVDSMHGLAYGGRGKAYTLSPPDQSLKNCKGPHKWEGVAM
jgi:hypothetical protein